MREGWEEKMLKEIGIAQTGTTPKTVDKGNYGNYIPFIKPADIDIEGDGDVRYNNEGLSQQGLKSARKIQKDSILMVCIGATIGKVGIVDRDVSCNQQINTLTLKKDIHPRFFYYALSSETFFNKVISNSAQATLPIIHKGKWESLTVCYPKSYGEQKPIVEILDETFAAIDKAKANVEKNLQNAKELFESYLQNVFAYKGEYGGHRRIQDITRVVNGYAFASSDFKSTNTIKSVKITNVGVKEFVEETDNYLPEKFKSNLKDYQVKEGNIVIALTRTIIPGGLKVAVVPESYGGALLNQRVAALVPNEKLINQRFLYNYLTTNGVEKYVLAHVNTLMQPNLSINDLKNLMVPCPPIKEQERICY